MYRILDGNPKGWAGAVDGDLYVQCKFYAAAHEMVVDNV